MSQRLFAEAGLQPKDVARHRSTIIQPVRTGPAREPRILYPGEAACVRRRMGNIRWPDGALLSTPRVASVRGLYHASNLGVEAVRQSGANRPRR